MYAVVSVKTWFGGSASPIPWTRRGMLTLVVQDNKVLLQKPRLGLTRLQGELWSGDPAAISRFYDEWVNFDEYVCLKRVNNVDGDVDYVFVKCRKRGNDVYKKWVWGKLHDLRYLDYPAVFITLTCDPKIWGCGRYDIWRYFSVHFNRFMSFVKKRLGDDYVGFFRVWESTKRGYPHIHIILFMKRFRFLPKWELEKQWGAYVDIRRCRSTVKAVMYLIKYLLKSLDEQNLTIQILWFLGMRSFGVSRSLLDLIRHKHNSNSIFQCCLDGSSFPVYSYYFLGVVWLGAEKNAAIYIMDKLPDLVLRQLGPGCFEESVKLTRY
jgi:hypothetical protein